MGKFKVLFSCYRKHLGRGQPGAGQTAGEVSRPKADIACPAPDAHIIIGYIREFTWMKVNRFAAGPIFGERQNGNYNLSRGP